MPDLVIRPAVQNDLEVLWNFLAMAAYEPDAEAAKAVPSQNSRLYLASNQQARLAMTASPRALTSAEYLRATGLMGSGKRLRAEYGRVDPREAVSIKNFRV